MKDDKIHPPKRALALLKYFIKEEYLEEIEGDLQETFEEYIKSYTLSKARRMFWIETIKLLRPAVMKNFEGTRKINPFGSMKDNLKLSFRYLKRNSLFTSINILGLSIGIASSIILLLFVADELSYDKCFTEADSIYKVALKRDFADHQSISRNVPHSFAKVAVDNFPEIESAVALTGPFRDMLITYEDDEGNRLKRYENVVAADSNFFAFFDFKLIKGDAKTALLEPRSMVLTESAAKRYYGEADPVGKILNMAGDDFIITAICKDLPINTHIQFDFLMSIHTIGRFNVDNFSRPDVSCYYKIKTNTNIKTLEDKFPELVDQYAAAEIEQLNNVSWEDYKKSGNNFHYFLVPLTSVYLHPDDLGGFIAGGNLTTTRIVFGVAILIMILACINFINLSTAKSLERAQEVGIRKILGSLKRQLVIRFLTEHLIISLLATLLAIGSLIITKDYFSTLTGKSLHLSYTYMLYTLLAGISIGLLAGLYPSFVITAHRPATVIKGKHIHKPGGNWFRDGLVVFQFVISIGCLLGMFVIKDQVNFLLNKDLGYDKEHLMVITGDFHMQPQFAQSLMDEIRTVSEVKAVAGSLSVPGLGIFWEDNIQIPTSTTIITTRSMMVGDGFAEVFGMRLKSGRLFSDQTQDATSVIVNESAVKTFNLDNPIGQKITQKTDDGNISQFEIIGVVEDFNFDYLYNAVSPLMIKSNEQKFNRSSKIAVRLQSKANVFDAVTNIEAKWKKLKPDEPFAFSFVDDIVDGYYEKEARLLSIFQVFSFLCIFIACIGLFALSTFMTSIRTKEIGIRKVLGASLFQLIKLLFKPFTKLIFIALFIGTPITLYVIENLWLNNFAYRIEINIWTIIMVSALILITTWFVIAYQTIKTSRLNPVDSLSEE